jgi:hypothetical protein
MNNSFHSPGRCGAQRKGHALSWPCAVAGALLCAALLFGANAGAFAADTPEYTLGTTVKGGTGGDLSKYAVSGWQDPEKEWTWTDGETAKLAVRIPPTQSDLLFKAVVNGFIHPPDLKSQPVEVLVNDKKVADWTLGIVGEHVATVPEEVAKKGGVVTFTFRMPKAVAPKAVGASADPRVLGMCMLRFELLRKAE